MIKISPQLIETIKRTNKIMQEKMELQANEIRPTRARTLDIPREGRAEVKAFFRRELDRLRD